MEKKNANTLLFIAGIGLTVAGIIFLLLAMFGEREQLGACRGTVLYSAF